jgi:ABC-type sugar transport system substrate-binding protein
LRRRLLLAGIAARTILPARAETKRYCIAFANLDETPGTTLEGLGFTGADVRSSFELAARGKPIDMLYFDNSGDPARAIANAQAAIDAHADLLIEYNADADANAEIARRMAAAGIPVLALIDPVPGAPLYGPDNLAAGLIAGRTLGAFARDTWSNETVLGVMIGDLADPTDAVNERVRGISQGVQESLPALKFATLDTGGQPVRADALLTKLLLTQRNQRMLIATLDDLAALYARNAIEMNRRQSDCVIVSQGLDRNIHGGANDKKEIDPANRGSVVLGSVAYFMDRYGYEVLPLALRLLQGGTLPQRTTTQHVLVSASNVFRIYPPFDIN